MSEVLFILEFENCHNRVATSVSKIDRDLVNVNFEGSFVRISIMEYKKNSKNKNIIQDIILPAGKLYRAETIDIHSPKCPPGYLELALREELNNGKS